MNSFQRTIKYIAIGFAIFLAVVIISAIINVGVIIASVVSGGLSMNKEKSIDFSEVFTDVSSLEVNNSTGKLTILEGDSFKVEAENVSRNFEAKLTKEGTLKVLDNSQNIKFLWFRFNGINNPNSQITVYLPKDFIAEDIILDSGAGNVNIDGVQTQYLMLSAGAGNINGSNIAAEKVKVDGGVGNVNLEKVSFEDSDFDCGVGNLTVNGTLLGKNKFDCGVGDVTLELAGDMDDYNIKVDAGVGNIRLNGEKISSEYENNNNSPNSIDIDGGVGNVTIEITQ
ncbi:MAG: putative rane protein [Herbinix sp.]|jgi:DUF4097 and DUF4098 domain-containing protein YvlB|nr:putative rane protein [Herbinix sp.]